MLSSWVRRPVLSSLITEYVYVEFRWVHARACDTTDEYQYNLWVSCHQGSVWSTSKEARDSHVRNQQSLFRFVETRLAHIVVILNLDGSIDVFKHSQRRGLVKECRFLITHMPKSVFDFHTTGLECINQVPANTYLCGVCSKYQVVEKLQWCNVETSVM